MLTEGTKMAEPGHADDAGPRRPRKEVDCYSRCEGSHSRIQAEARTDILLALSMSDE